MNSDEVETPTGPPPPNSRWMFVACYPLGSSGWVAVPIGAPAPVVSARLLAQRARDQFRLPKPRPGSSPAGETLVHLTTYLYIDPASWRPMTASAAVPGTAVTVTATPRHIDWSMGDNGTVSCPGPGAPYGKPGSSACRYQYRQSSSKRQGSTRPGYLVTARTTWTVAWSCTGTCDETGGTLDPLTPSESMRLPVAEARSQLVAGTR